MSTIIDVSVEDVEKKRLPSKHYVYMIIITGSDGFQNVIQRRYSRFFELQCRILDRFPVEAGRYNPSERILPFLPGKILFGRSQVRAVALKRLQSIDNYCKELLKLQNVMDSPEVQEFYSVTDEDLNPDDSFEKIKAKKNMEIEAKEISAPVLNEQYVAIASYDKDGLQEVCLVAGEMVDVIEKCENGWWFVSSEDGQGWAPSSFLERTDGLEEDTATPLQTGEGSSYVCTKNYAPQFDDEVRLNKGVPIEVIEKNLNGWWKVRSGDKVGKAPATYLEKTDTVRAKRIMGITEKFSNEAKIPQRPEMSAIPTNRLKVPETKAEPIYIALADFVGQAPGTMNLQEGVQVKVIDKNVTGWSYVQVGSKEGWVPTNIIKRKEPLSKKLSPARPPLPKGRGSPQPTVRQAGPSRAISPQPQVRQTGPARAISPQPHVRQTGPARAVSPQSNVRQTGPARAVSPQPHVRQSGPARAISPKPVRHVEHTSAARSTSPRPAIPSSQAANPMASELQQKLNARRGNNQGRAMSPESKRSHSPQQQAKMSATEAPKVNKFPFAGHNAARTPRWTGPLSQQNKSETDSDESDKEYTNEDELEQARVKFVKSANNKPRQLPIPPNQANKPRPALPQKKPGLPQKPKPKLTNGSAANQSSGDLLVRAMRNRFEQS